MALTVDTSVAAMSQVTDKSADRLRKYFTVTGPSSYSTGGVSFTPQELGFGQFVQTIGNNVARAGTAIRLVTIDNANPSAPKMMWFLENFTEVSNGTDLSTYSATIEFIGK